MISYEELNLVFDMNNPLTLEYFELCDKDTDELKYFEKHHILPKSIFPEYTKSEWNLVRLTYQNHYKAHEILAQICISEQHSISMLHAWNIIAHKAYAKIDAITYSILRENRVNALTGKKQSQEHVDRRTSKLIGLKRSEEQIKEMSRIRMGSKLLESTKIKISESLTGRTQSKENIEKRASKIRGRKYTEEHCKNMSKGFTPEIRKRMSEIRLGTTNSEETRKHISESLTGRSHSRSEIYAHQKFSYLQYDKTGILISCFAGWVELRENNFNGKCVSAVCNGYRKTYKGFVWKKIPKTELPV